MTGSRDERRRRESGVRRRGGEVGGEEKLGGGWCGEGGVERDLRQRLRADVSVDDDGCSLLKCRVVIMRRTRSLVAAHFPPL